MKYLSKNIIVRITIACAVCLLTLQVAAYAQERVAVIAGVANMRSGPGTKNDVLWQVEKYHPLIVVEKKGKWYRVKDFENDEAWIHNSLLGNVKTVITIKDKCNIRSKPTTKSSVIFTAERGVPFKVLKMEGNWIKVEHADGDVGWIYKTLVW